MATEPGLTTFELLTIIGSVMVGTGAVVAAVFSGANSLRQELWKGIAKVSQWQVTHDRKDDHRFQIIDQQLSDITYRNSVKDGVKPRPHRPINDIVAELENGRHGGQEEEGDD